MGQEAEHQLDTIPVFTQSEESKQSENKGLRLDTLLNVRWIAALCQGFTVFFVSQILDFPIPILPCFALVGLSVFLNIYAKLTQKRVLRVSNRVACLHLSYDIIQLALLLYLTGGLVNPFSIYLLGPVLIAASTLRIREALGLGVLVIIIATILVYFHQPFPMINEELLYFNDYYLLAIWASLMSCLIFMGFYAHRVTVESQNLAAALTATELVLAKEQHLSALDGLAAAAAHELGTPLSTISVVVKELEREWGDHPKLSLDLDLLISQTARCRDILGKLTSLSADGGGPMVALRLTDLVEEIAAPYHEFDIKLEVHRHSSVSDHQNIPVVKRLPGVIYGLGNLLENAIDFAIKKVDIIIAWDEDGILIKIIDDGPGFNEGVASRLGEPYVTSRPSIRPSERPSVEGGGLGLGIFIAKTLLERSGAKVDFANRLGNQSGADITIIWPPEALIHKEQKNKPGPAFV